MTVGAPGDAIVSPIDGIIKRHGRPSFAKGKEHLSLTEIIGTGPYEGEKWKIMYVDRNGPQPGTAVSRGEKIGHYQDAPSAYGAPNMKHHIHVELRRNGRLIDPGPLFPGWKSQKPTN